MYDRILPPSTSSSSATFASTAWFCQITVSNEIPAIKSLLKFLTNNLTSVSTHSVILNSFLCRICSTPLSIGCFLLTCQCQYAHITPIRKKSRPKRNGRKELSTELKSTDPIKLTQMRCSTPTPSICTSTGIDFFPTDSQLFARGAAALP